MTNQHYNDEAAILAALLAVERSRHPDTSLSLEGAYDDGARTAIGNIASAMADWFTKDDPLFDRERFFTAYRASW